MNVQNSFAEKQAANKGVNLHDWWLNHANALNGIHVHRVRSADVRYVIAELKRASLTLAYLKSPVSFAERWITWRDAYVRFVKAIERYAAADDCERQALNAVNVRATSLHRIAQLGL